MTRPWRVVLRLGTGKAVFGFETWIRVVQAESEPQARVLGLAAFQTRPLDEFPRHYVKEITLEVVTEEEVLRDKKVAGVALSLPLSE